MKKIAVFASGSGSNFQALVDAAKANQLSAEIVLMVCDKPRAYAIERADKAGVPSLVISPKDFASKTDYEKEILQKLNESGVELIVLAGYMRLIGETLLSAYEGRIVNIHPSLLPSFAGKDAIGQAFQAKVKITGVTVHYVDEGMDTGPIIAQEAVKMDEHETRESLEAKIHQVEHLLYPRVIQKLCSTDRKV
ncbi:phosphoribosylglycinamide formyltransferase [Schinkia azotoformans]|uniref:Phosphoribosylglycinamide formyltransferase n=1 Tax=Schinkia azotoformans LMG 9581 TaxID=1131731 RepID=K6D165_SCHAZ|nr:phosphoribosylglycinamide formyltransferase [Schinkia azotoformans]EKN66227.1 phosphoribosylglycinamide formyltransferase [Schinkia azotoformans LMG 9581]MEC1640013.1 phosphoribosylglycinamide formyltransferase [Schinkia azotoformans]MEC1947509.1 phosphoribosylglycinamide formyltransferase [Schinkia azotoformans]